MNFILEKGVKKTVETVGIWIRNCYKEKKIMIRFSYAYGTYGDPTEIKP
tara:strand:+ start:772 stop:918 length:147 start_codon:yes stop_codon:yes gene_type:complete